MVNQVRVDDARRDEEKGKIRKKRNGKSKDWILYKKDTQRQKGKEVRPDTKYIGRKRNDKS